ncbi:ribonuclease H-like protein [Rhizophagus irregularis]|uniref:DNA polymerase delta catalytic subunit n=1 Tax=Rhizophagus irregularis TaxID=588596 RepID=A0A2N1MCT8_9GLOM|nr:ribonuclease H-like protein [Rhizophagus irregularis]
MHTPTVSDQTDRSGPLVYYNSAGPLAGILSCNDIIAEYDNGISAILEQSLSGKQPIHFMPTEVSDDTKYVNGVSTYILRITSSLINGQKAVVNITGIRPFFDVVVPEEMALPMFKTKLVRILSNILNGTSKFGIKAISAFPLQGYHTEKKPYIRVRTWNHFDRNKVLKAVHAVGMCTASDYLTCQYYYRKVAREERLPLSSWAVLSNYLYEHIQGGTYLFQVSVNNYNPISDDKYSNPLISSILLRDRTLVLTWDIETYSSRRMGGVPNAKYEEDVVFMICMTVHWKDDPKPLKQICLVDVETAPDPQWITVICRSQTNLLKAFALCWKNLAPDIHIGFNDSQYDWRFIVEKADKLGVLEWMFNHMSFKPSSLEKIIKWEYRYNMIKGLENRRPVTGLDFASLYLNLIITYNLSPDKIILFQEHAVSHNNISEEKGLYTSVLKYLSGKRNEMKKRLTSLKEKKEEDLVISSMGKSSLLSETIEQILANAEVEKHNGLTKNLYHFIHKGKYEFIAEYDSICFDCSCLDKKQYAFKVYMNTFYGMAGDSKSPSSCVNLLGPCYFSWTEKYQTRCGFCQEKGIWDKIW